MNTKMPSDGMYKCLDDLERELSGCRFAGNDKSAAVKRLSDILDGLEAIVYVADMQSFEILYVNKYTERIIGNIVGTKCWEFLHARQAGPCPFCTKPVDLQGNFSPSFRKHRKTIDNKWYVVHNQDIEWFDGRIVRLEIAFDVTGYKQAEEALRKSEEKFRTIADYTYNWEYWLDDRGEFVYISPSCEGLSGYRPEEFRKDPDLMLAITCPEDKQLLGDHLENDFRKNQVIHLEFRIITRQGDVRWIAHTCQPVFDAQGVFKGRRASNRNITRLKTTEERLFASEKRFQLALDASSDCIWERDLATGEMQLGDNWYSVLGFDLDDIERERFTWGKLIHPDERRHIEKEELDYITGKSEKFETECRLRNKKGEWQWFLSRGRIVEWDEAGRPMRMVGTHSDITCRKALELELQRASNELEKRVGKRTVELEETNVALNVLLKKRLEDKSAIEQRVLDNLSHLVDPYINKLESSGLNHDQQKIVDILKFNLQELTAGFNQSLTTDFARLTPTEIQVVNLVKQGKASKEIAGLMNLSPGTVNIHRKNIRKKLGLTNRKINMRSALANY